jgi:hypothetical protein
VIVTVAIVPALHYESWIYPYGQQAAFVHSMDTALGANLTSAQMDYTADGVYRCNIPPSTRSNCVSLVQVKCCCLVPFAHLPPLVGGWLSLTPIGHSLPYLACRIGHGYTIW